MILVAEDNEINQIVVEQILINAGHSYAIVENGRLALEQFKAERPDLVLMDVSMPEINGLVATEARRAAERDAGDGVRTPIIGLTAHALKGDKGHCHINRRISQLAQLGAKVRPPCPRFAKPRTMWFKAACTSAV